MGIKRKMIQIIVTMVEDEEKVKTLADLYKDKLTDWDYHGKVYEVYDTINDEIRNAKVVTCFGTMDDFAMFSKAYAAVINNDKDEVFMIDCQEEASKHKVL